MRKERCLNCHQFLESFGDDEGILTIYHDSPYDCIRALVKRVDILEDELMARKLSDTLSRSSDTGLSSTEPSPPPFDDAHISIKER